MPYPRVLPIGDAALTLELGDSIDPVVNARVRAADQALLGRPFAGFLEAVPTYRSLLVRYDPGLASLADARAAVLERVPNEARSPRAGALRRIPTVYDGPDLDDVARATGLTRAEVVRRHSAREYTAHMLGFTPGFAYLGLLDEALATARRATPRVRVPAGAVAVAGLQTAIYPRASAGGWNLIGRTSLRLFDPQAAAPCLIEAGDRVRFEPVADLPDAPANGPSWTPTAGALAVEVLHAGLLTTVQDRGRPGQRRLGVSDAGAADRRALDAANAALGNPPQAAALECTIEGPALRFLAPVRFAVAGADLGAVLERPDLGDWRVPLATSVLARAGNVLVFRGRSAGCRAYVALASGIAMPLLLGSRSTDLAAGFGGLEGRALRAGDILSVETPLGARPPAIADRSPAPQTTSVRVILGPQQDHFDRAAVDLLYSTTFAVLPSSDRVACRLSGATLRPSGPGEIVSDGMLPGCIQVPPDGQPIIMLAECPTTGGYPKIATVVAADLWQLAQLVPGEGRVRFVAA